MLVASGDRAPLEHSLGLIWDGWFTNWKFAFDSDPRLHDLKIWPITYTQWQCTLRLNKNTNTKNRPIIECLEQGVFLDWKPFTECEDLQWAVYRSSWVITWSEQLPCTRITLFSQTSLFFEGFCGELRIYFRSHKPVSKTKSFLCHIIYL